MELLNVHVVRSAVHKLLRPYLIPTHHDPYGHFEIALSFNMNFLKFLQRQLDRTNCAAKRQVTAW